MAQSTEALRPPEGDPSVAVWWKASERIGGWDAVGLDGLDEIAYECCHLHGDRASAVACGKRTMPGIEGPSR